MSHIFSLLRGEGHVSYQIRNKYDASTYYTNKVILSREVELEGFYTCPYIDKIAG
jgi:hypothetical protein